MQTDRTSSSEFEQLLAWLGPDRERAGEEYERLRLNLLDYFRRRGAEDPAGLADEVIARVTAKVGEVAPGFVGEPAAYFFAVARHVLSEWRRRPVQVELPAHLASMPEQTRDDTKEQLLECLEQCWARLTAQEGALLSRYCLGTPPQKLAESREWQARELGMTLNALRVTAHRLKAKVRRCVGALMRKKSEINGRDFA
jgi:DNA-directed RNA polymerase specialized sigma24 family protein